MIRVQAPPYLVGLAGPAGVGKTSVAQALCVLSNLRSVALPAFTRQRFAGPIKDMLSGLCLTRAQLDGAEKEAPCDLLGGKTPRWAMRSLGDWGRNNDPDFWVRPAVCEAERYLLAGFGVVLDDVRFANEAAAIIDLGGIIVQLSREGAAPSTMHASEAGLNPRLITYRVPNDQTPADAAVVIAKLLTDRISQ